MDVRMSLLTGILSLGLFVSQTVAITDGQVDGKNIYANVGAVVLVASDGSAAMVAFSGILIHPRVFLTAGHCTVLAGTPMPPGFSRAYVTFDADAFNAPTTRQYPLGAIITHPDYNPIHNQSCNDVGAIILSEPVCGVPLAKLPREGFLDDLKAAGLLREPGECGTPLTVAGYGATRTWPPPGIVDGDGWRRFAQSDYLALTPGWLYNLTNPATGNGGIGFGDSGGPAFWVGADGALTLVALTGHADPNLLAINVAWRVDIPETLEFIDWVISMVEPETDF